LDNRFPVPCASHQHRDLALILVLGAMGLRSEETRVLTSGSIAPKRADGLTPWLTLHGKGAKTRELPIPPEVADALLT
jgi:site-specific recombinase XerC